MRKIHERLLGVVKEQSNQRIREAKQMRLNRLKKSKKRELPPVLEFLIKTELTTQSLSALKWLNPEIDNEVSVSAYRKCANRSAIQSLFNTWRTSRSKRT